MKIRTEAAQFLFEEYLFRIFDIMSLKCDNCEATTEYITFQLKGSKPNREQLETVFSALKASQVIFMEENTSSNGPKVRKE